MGLTHTGREAGACPHNPRREGAALGGEGSQGPGKGAQSCSRGDDQNRGWGGKDHSGSPFLWVLPPRDPTDGDCCRRHTVFRLRVLAQAPSRQSSRFLFNNIQPIGHEQQIPTKKVWWLFCCWVFFSFFFWVVDGYYKKQVLSGRHLGQSQLAQDKGSWQTPPASAQAPKYPLPPPHSWPCPGSATPGGQPSWHLEVPGRPRRMQDVLAGVEGGQVGAQL